MQAEGALELEKDSKAERFSLGEPATLPQRPVSPNRAAIAMGGLVASLGSGLGLAFLREIFDPSIKGPLQLARIASVSMLIAIPYIETRSSADARDGGRGRWLHSARFWRSQSFSRSIPS
jgi:capsular polysaccharide biosynthesis protein